MAAAHDMRIVPDLRPTSIALRSAFMWITESMREPADPRYWTLGKVGTMPPQLPCPYTTKVLFRWVPAAFIFWRSGYIGFPGKE